MFKTSSGIGRTLEWRETAPPCEKCLLADQLKPQFHFSTCRFSDVSAFCRFRRFDVQTIFKCGFGFCLVVLVCWLDLLRPSLLYQRSVKRRHHWACPMCLCGTLRWSGGGGDVVGVAWVEVPLSWEVLLNFRNF